MPALGEDEDIAVAEEGEDQSAWFTDDGSEDIDASFKDYDITASPNDFNIRTIVDFIEAGPFQIPGFQRNYVWDRKRASKLIESVLIGLPVPQIFLYEEDRNKFLVIDGQQRLMSIYYFVKGRFPRRAQRPAIRRIVAEKGLLPKEILADDAYFQKFNLYLPGAAGGQRSRFHGKNFETLGEDQTTFNLRTIRNVIIKQNSPKEDRDTSIFEIFNRLNTGGVNLRPQEIRGSLYHSRFMERLNKLNIEPVWRALIGQPEPDLHAKDTEILLRVVALTMDGEHYAEPIGQFLNTFAKKARALDDTQLSFLESLFSAFLAQVKNVSMDVFRVERTGRFSIAMFEAVFRAACTDALKNRSLDVWPLTNAALASLKSDKKFIEATKEGIGRATHVTERYERARELLAIKPAG
ncbi:DUF262 domain-containing protein [Bradyrhizobium manausense]|uniref:GmrSD restriction endonucleases N-terminal domain-containing protein n=1 Tax=Bradyrhizobium manausense TaxID=989370 RepID=A0A0R3DGW7_9BRAD|nr:DUF262 domain-containing protein [Bradyrhizobium manausense]KRQ09130.1 hypothetical protein AOQ71_21100 [Bradyrhizobium manausense]